jgi:O-acetylhomoserine/O-acetylserine sulfhydrylase-like pyridoxal-dependent enzyme
LLQGIETLAVRMERHVENARAVAHFVRADPGRLLASPTILTTRLR